MRNLNPSKTLTYSS